MLREPLHPNHFSESPAERRLPAVSIGVVGFAVLVLGSYVLVVISWDGGPPREQVYLPGDSVQFLNRTWRSVPEPMTAWASLTTEEPAAVDRLEKDWDSIVALWQRFYFGLWETAGEQKCREHHISESCCKEILRVALTIRYKIYLSCTLAFLAGGALFLCGYSCGPRFYRAPPKYWRSYHRAFLSKNFQREVDVTAELRESVQKLLDLTTESRKMCIKNSMDGFWVRHKKFRVTNVTRIENGYLWTAYKQGLRASWTVNESLKHMPQAMREKTRKALSVIKEARSEYLKDKQVAKFVASMQLDDSRNETLLFHACPRSGARDPKTGDLRFASDQVSPLQAVAKIGFDDRLGNASGMLGSGIYFADKASKADQYAGKYGGPDDTTVGEEASMFLARVVLGCPYLTENTLEQLRRPPCVHGHFDHNLAWSNVKYGKPWKEKGLPMEMCDHHRFDSVISNFALDGKTKLYREYVVYGRQCYPEFRVTYVREA